MSCRSKRFLVLDAMRGLAACMVATLHYHYDLLHTQAIYLAVDFFLLLSGFVLAHAHFRDPDFKFWRFAQARFARLYPLHIVTLLFTLALFTAMGRVWFDGELVLHLLMMHNIGLGPPRLAFNAPAWSISVEFWVNLLIGALLAKALVTGLSGEIRRIALAIISACCFILIAWSTGHLNVYHQHLVPFINLGMLRGLASFCLGILLYDAWKILDQAEFSRHGMVPNSVSSGCLIAFPLLMFLSPGETAFDFVILALFAIILLVASLEIGPVARWMSMLSPLGTISFSIYLTHQPILYALQYYAPEFYATKGAYIVVMSGVLVISVLTYRFIEMPGYKLGKLALQKTGNILRLSISGSNDRGKT